MCNSKFQRVNRWKTVHGRGQTKSNKKKKKEIKKTFSQIETLISSDETTHELLPPNERRDRTKNARRLDVQLKRLIP